jgi:putative ABC transport system substrate-binding protein
MLVLASVIAILVLNRQQAHSVQIGIIEPMVHSAVSDITRGIRDGLGVDSNSKVIVHINNANGDATVIPQIIKRYKDLGVSAFVPIFTATAQATKTTAGTTPIVFAAVTNPVAAGLLNDPLAPEGNITGVSDLWPIDTQFKLIKRIIPQASKVGIVFDPNDNGSSQTMPLIRNSASAHGMQLFEKPVYSVAEIASVLPQFKGNVDFIFTANDVTITKAFPALVAFAVENKIPLFAGDYSSVQRGAIAAVGQNYYNVGYEAGKMAASILKGEKIASLPVHYTQGGDLHLNVTAAEKMGVKIPDDIRAEAQHVYTTISEGN